MYKIVEGCCFCLSKLIKNNFKRDLLLIKIANCPTGQSRSCPQALIYYIDIQIFSYVYEKTLLS